MRRSRQAEGSFGTKRRGPAPSSDGNSGSGRESRFAYLRTGPDSHSVSTTKNGTSRKFEWQAEREAPQYATLALSALAKLVAADKSAEPENSTFRCRIANKPSRTPAVIGFAPPMSERREKPNRRKLPFCWVSATPIPDKLEQDFLAGGTSRRIPVIECCLERSLPRFMMRDRASFEVACGWRRVAPCTGTGTGAIGIGIGRYRVPAAQSRARSSFLNSITKE